MPNKKNFPGIRAYSGPFLSISMRSGPLRKSVMSITSRTQILGRKLMWTKMGSYLSPESHVSRDLEPEIYGNRGTVGNIYGNGRIDC